tara:strand:- start:314 stop:1489 length:1176 start_codon:yes stop_codon:yes gene_type:complete
MRTLNRPMFNMGGPIKQGIMHGIREPHNSGGRTGFYTGGISAAKWLATLAPKAAKTFGNVGARYNLGNIGGGTARNLPMVMKQPGWGARIADKWKGIAPSWLQKSIERDPTTRALKWTHGALTGPTAKTWGKKAVQAIGTPTGLFGAGYIGSQFIGGDDKPDAGDAPISVPLNPALQELQKKGKGTGTGSAGDFAKSQREDRLNRYLKLMGYDTAKKTAIADALIDASKIVSDRGTLDRKNITAELINPAIQALSQRLDKPQQIREAVGLMMTKGEIEKDLEDPQVKKLRALQIEKGEKELTPGVGPSIMAYMAAKKGKVKGDELKDLVRLAANQEGTPFTYMSEEDIAKFPQLEGKTALEIVSSTAETDGVYMVGDAVIEIKGGIPKQIK